MAKPQSTDWLKMKHEDMQKIIVELAKEGKGPAEIGLILRDKHGIPKAKLVGGKKIKEILIESKLTPPSEKEFVERKIKVTEKHIISNKHDYTAKRALAKNLWIVHKLKQ